MQLLPSEDNKYHTASKWKQIQYMHLLETNTLYTTTSQTVHVSRVCVCVFCLCELSWNDPATVELWRAEDLTAHKLESWHRNFKGFLEIWTNNIKIRAVYMKWKRCNTHKFCFLSVLPENYTKKQTNPNWIRPEGQAWLVYKSNKKTNMMHVYMF